MSGPGGKANPNAQPKLRLDKWLWQARFFKSREDATEVVEDGHLRINGQRCQKPGHGVGAGDVLTFPQANRIRVVRVLALGQRRGPATEAQRLYVDLDASRSDALGSDAPGSDAPGSDATASPLE